MVIVACDAQVAIRLATNFDPQAVGSGQHPDGKAVVVTQDRIGGKQAGSQHTPTFFETDLFQPKLQGFHRRQSHCRHLTLLLVSFVQAEGLRENLCAMCRPQNLCAMCRPQQKCVICLCMNTGKRWSTVL